MKLTCYQESGYSESFGAYIQGALQYKIYGPAGRAEDAREIAVHLAQGGSKSELLREGDELGIDYRGFRVIYAGHVN